MFSNVATGRNSAIDQNWIDQLFNVGLMAFVGCWTVAMLAIGGPLPDGSAHVTMPVAERLVDQHVFRASSHEPFPQQVFSETDAPVGQGWG